SAPGVAAGARIVADPAGRPARKLAYAVTPSGPLAAALLGDGELALVGAKERKALVGPSTSEESRVTLTLPVGGSVTELLVDGRGEDLFAGTSEGQLVRVDVRDPRPPGVAETLPAARRPGSPITVLGFLIGDRTLVVGDAAGGVSSWQVLPGAGGERRLQRIHEFAPHDAAVVAFAPSRRDKGFVTAG